MSFIVNPPGGLDPLIFTLNAALTPVDFTGSGIIATVQRPSQVVKIINAGDSSGLAKGIYGPGGYYSFRVEVAVRGTGHVNEFWEAFVGATASSNDGEIYATFEEVVIQDPVIVQTHVNPDSFSTASGSPQNATATAPLVAANFRLTTLVAAAGFEFCEVCLCWLGP